MRWLIAVLVLAAWANAGSAEFDLEVTADELPGVISNAETVTVRLWVANEGRQPWATGDGYALSYHWLHGDGEVAHWDGVRTELGKPVSPGEIRELRAVVRAPDRSGDYLLQWDVVQEGVRWLSEVDPTPVAPVPVRVTATHAFSVIELDLPRVLCAGAGRPARMVLRNDGTAAWPGDGSVSVATHWFDADGDLALWEGRRTAIDRQVLPGEAVSVGAMVVAPRSPGRYRLQWDMVEDGVCWFSERDGEPEPCPVVVVVPASLLSPATWAVLTTLAAIIAVATLRRRRRGPGLELWAVADVVWFVGAVTVKQAFILDATDAALGVAGWCTAAATAAACGLVLLMLPLRVRSWLAWTGGALATALLYADCVHLRFFGDLGSVAALRSLGQIGQVGASVRALLELRDLWFWADLPAAFVLATVAMRLSRRGSSRRRPAIALAVIAAVAACCGAVAMRRVESSFRQVFRTTELARHIGVLNLHALDLGRTAVAGLVHRPLDPDELAEIVGYFDQGRPLRAGTGATFAAADGDNLVMIQVESLQAFVVGFRVGGREVTPFLNRLAEENFWFANVTDQTEEGRSSDSELATQVSLLPPDRGAAAFLNAGNHFTGLAAILGEHGYATLSAVPFDGSFWNRRLTHRAYGFQRSLFAEDFLPGPTIGWGLNDRDFLVQAAHRLTELPEPWCAYLITLSLHHPFEGFPDEEKELDVGIWEGTPFGNFIHTMHFMDRALESFVASLDDAGLLGRTVLAIWGDHDAGFEWRPEIAAAIGEPADSRGWYLSQQIPLVVRVPALPGPGHPLGLPAGHVDVAPTLLALLGVDPSPYAWLGRNLLGAPGPGPVVGEYRCFSDASFLYLRHGPALADGECVDLASLRAVPVTDCAVPFERARRQVEVSTSVLDHDLQETVHLTLSAQP